MGELSSQYDEDQYLARWPHTETPWRGGGFDGIRMRGGRQGVAQAAEHLKKNDFVILRDVVHPLEVAILSRMYREGMNMTGQPFKTMGIYDQPQGRTTVHSD